MKNIIPIFIVIVIIVGAGAFFAGTKYQSVQGTRGNFGNGQFRGRGFNTPSGTNRSVLRGSVIDMSGSSMTIKLQDGSSKIVILSDKTVINKSTQGTKDDLKSGENVAVFGSNNSDGSVTAEDIQLNPQLRIPNPNGQPNGQ